MVTVTIELPDDALEALRRPVVGQGGFQSLLRELQDRVGTGSVLTLTPDLIARIVRYVQDYGQGGFQGRLDTVLAELGGLARSLQPLASP